MPETLTTRACKCGSELTGKANRCKPCNALYLKAYRDKRKGSQPTEFPVHIGEPELCILRHYYKLTDEQILQGITYEETMVGYVNTFISRFKKSSYVKA